MFCKFNLFGMKILPDQFVDAIFLRCTGGDGSGKANFFYSFVFMMEIYKITENIV